MFDLADGRAIETPIDWFPMLQAAPKEAREEYEIEDDGKVMCWPVLGERVSVEAVLLLRYPTSA
ncbi:DUF2442 domain-containing protein [Croceibacterium sp. LX-88]|uniref:DUF2442 domain-containing protein n=1 Tax=Croceibacterium selenioxidans TaxID=2838833 RepID=A0ABS5W2H6_9SPHN|nr:DUF2442 domain-containing protein [Croceibacterium selenioxidans]